ncbi:starch synthase (maltosyl-transferring) [Streptacidiphilus sp. MAP12-16]|uniref:maltotransferase domain-containing protein n=1 Tax=Streptacidiphilus sp. MAP12-16 TaxID=3156300 RepID=UPI003510EFB7
MKSTATHSSSAGRTASAAAAPPTTATPPMPPTTAPPTPPAAASPVGVVGGLGGGGGWPEPVWSGRLQISDVCPVVAGGTRPARAVPGEGFEVSATVFREGHQTVAADLVLVRRDGTGARRIAMAESGPGTDWFTARLAVGDQGDFTYWIEAWSDPVATWRRAAVAKVPAGVDLELVFAEGVALLDRVTAHAAPYPHADADADPDAHLDAGAVGVGGADSGVWVDGVGEAGGEGPLTGPQRTVLARVRAALGDRALAPAARLAAALDPPVTAALAAHPLREQRTASAPLPLRVDRPRALYGSWYEFFPRSEGAVLEPADGGPARSGTLRTAAARLAAVAEMGFDVVYLPPIHPIGTSGRKGPGNTTTAAPGDPGSPWAIGAAAGGHDAVHPDLGTVEDFDYFVATADALGLEVALDFALQCSPDHPWVTAHPQWFHQQLDGTIAYAQNPPKKYEDIYPIDFEADPAGLLAESLRVLRHWMDHGVRIFRVDNPHTKPVFFWEQLIAAVHATDPDVLFLAEAFTRPAMMLALARAGFHQSYSYFTWRETKAELTGYLAELAGLPGPQQADGSPGTAGAASAAYLRPNLFVNTPDILPDHLRDAPRAAFAIRAVLAATAGPSWGVYAGFELCENTAAAAGSQDYAQSEKYQYRPRDWRRAEASGASLAPLIGDLNRLRRAHPALQQLRNLALHPTDNDALLCLSKHTLGPGGADWVVAVINLDPSGTQEGWVRLDLAALGLEPGSQVQVHDALSGQVFTWGEHNYVRLDPAVHVAHLLTATAPA